MAVRCEAGVRKGGYSGKEAEAGYRLCEQALAVDPNNARALTWLSSKFVWVDTKTDLKRAEELASKALTLDPNYAQAHFFMGDIRSSQGRLDEAIAEYERALALDPAMVSAFGELGWDYLYLGEFEKSLEYFDKAIRLSPHDPLLGGGGWYDGEAAGYFALKQYDQAIEWARRGIAVDLTDPWLYFNLIAALALAGHEAEAHGALQNYLGSVPSGPKTIAAWKAAAAPYISARSNPRYLETLTGITTACPRRGCRRNKAQRGRRRSHPARRADQSQSSHARRPPPLSSAPQTSASYSDVQPSQALDQRAISPHHCLSCPRKRASSRGLPRL